MISLWLYQRLAISADAYVLDLTRHLPNWHRSIRGIGGFWTGDGTITTETMPARMMADLFHVHLGGRIREITHGVTTWEGEIVQMDFTRKGITHRRSLGTEQWHNKVKVAYVDNATSVAAATAWSEDTDSSDTYGESCYIDVVGDSYDSTSATAARDRRLKENAFPKPFPVGGLSSGQGSTSRPDSLHIYCAGYVFGMNRRWRESDTAAANVSTQIGVLVGESEFITAGLIETNTLSVPISGSEIAFRLWDGIDEFIQMGDASGNRWAGGVYVGRKFDYDLAETTVTHYWHAGRLLDLNWTPIPASLIKPDIIVQVTDALFSPTPMGGNVWDNPRNIYIEEVEFIAPDSYRLVPYGGGGL